MKKKLISASLAAVMVLGMCQVAPVDKYSRENTTSIYYYSSNDGDEGKPADERTSEQDSSVEKSTGGLLDVETDTATNTDALSDDYNTDGFDTTDTEEVTDNEIPDDDAVMNEYCNYKDDGVRVDYYEPSDEFPALYSAIPSSYDSRDAGYVTSVKDQQPYGTCWAFSALGAGEASLLARGMGNTVSTLDFSEYQLAYFFYHHVNDPLGNLQGDYTNPIGGDYLSVGGNNYFTMFALASWCGAADEALAPYENASTVSTLPSSLAYEDVAHMQGAYIVSMENMDDVKKMIMDYGAVASAVYMSTYYYYNSETDALYQDYTKNSNHAIMIVGWDDNYPAENFSENCRPMYPGAWLIKNSWGDDQQYFWVSYMDTCLSQQDAFAFIMESADNYDYNYQYDGGFGSSSYKISNGNSLANVFTVNGSTREQIEAVSVALASSNVRYSVQIYKNPETGDPTSGTPMLTTPLVGETTYAGYYTVELDTPVVLSKGDTFSVVYTLESLEIGRDYSYCYVDCSGSQSWIEFECHSEADQSYYINANGTISDLYEEYPDMGVAPRIKAFTSKVNTGTLISASEFTVSKVADRQYTGNLIKPSPTVKYQGKKLTRDVDYVLSYSNNRARGTATITIKGVGKYKGSKKVTFKIVACLNPTTVYGGINYSAVYDYNYYIKKYPELWNKYHSNDVAVLRHFVTTGMKEGRQAKSTFNVKSYAYRYSDLRKKYKNDLKSYYLHYIKTGKKEGRIATGTTKAKGYQTVYNGIDYSAVYDYNYYISKYSDVRKAYGLDDAAVLKHFVTYGMKEGRRGSEEFSVSIYKNRYADLKKAFGSDLKLYYLHYIRSGKKEGRKAN
ncbi:MAG: lectin like domain-containing protein [Wujia sp.]